MGRRKLKVMLFLQDSGDGTLKKKTRHINLFCFRKIKRETNKTFLFACVQIIFLITVSKPSKNLRIFKAMDRMGFHIIFYTKKNFCSTVISVKRQPKKILISGKNNE